MKVFWQLFKLVSLILTIFFLTSNILVDKQLIMADVLKLALIVGGMSLFLAFFSETILSTIGSKSLVIGVVTGLKLLVAFMFITTIIFPSRFGPIDGMESIRTFTKIRYLQDIIKNLAVGLGCIFLYKLATKKTISLVKLIAALVIITSLGTFLINSIQNKKVQYLSGWDLLAKQYNVIIVIADGLQGSFVEDVFANRPEIKNKYADFTFYPKALSPHVYTSFSLPALLAGSTKYHRELQEYKEILDAVKKDNFIITAQSKGFETVELPNPMLQDFVVDPDHAYIRRGTNSRSLVDLFEIGLTRSMPLFVSRLYYEYQHDKIHHPMKDLSKSFWNEFEDHISVGTSNKALILRHSMLSHLPVYFNKFGQEINIREANYSQALDEVIYTLESYTQLFARMKAQNVWESALVIIAADHGSHYKFAEDELSYKGDNLYALASYNPAILIKYPGLANELTVNDQVISNTDIRAIVECYLTDPVGNLEGCYDPKRMRTVFTTTVHDKEDMGYYYSLDSYRKEKIVGGLDSLKKIFSNL